MTLSSDVKMPAAIGALKRSPIQLLSNVVDQVKTDAFNNGLAKKSGMLFLIPNLISLPRLFLNITPLFAMGYIF